MKGRMALGKIRICSRLLSIRAGRSLRKQADSQTVDIVVIETEGSH
jgi:hypothetical protein